MCNICGSHITVVDYIICKYFKMYLVNIIPNINYICDYVDVFRLGCNAVCSGG
jgi:hypothetical protein